MMTKKIELLAPGGDLDCIKAAIAAGADAIYCGLHKFNARNRAKNITLDELRGVLRLAHSKGCQIFLTLNTIIVESEISALITLLNKLVNTRIDGIIVQDLGLLYLLQTKFKSLKVHASTQLTSHNKGQLKFLKELSATRVNLSRELSIDEIGELSKTAREEDLLVEVFVHGSQCLSFSGLCYFSSLHGGNSGNRGRCSQPCRDEYINLQGGARYPFNLKDNSAFSLIGELANAGVDSVKIEGRIKKFHYVYTVVEAWRRQLGKLQEHRCIDEENSLLHKVFNRGFSTSYLDGDINKSMFIDNPRDNSAQHLFQEIGCSKVQDIRGAKQEIYDQKTDIIKDVKDKIATLDISKTPVTMKVTGAVGKPLAISVQSSAASFVVHSKSALALMSKSSKEIKKGEVRSKKNRASKNRGSLEQESLLRFFQTINETEYTIENLEVKLEQPGLFVPFNELNSLKKELLFRFNGNRKPVPAQDALQFKKRAGQANRPTLSVIISSQRDIDLCRDSEAKLYFQLPAILSTSLQKYIDLFLNNRQLIPWFPSILIGSDFDAAIEFLEKVRPVTIVTNNSGIGYEAYKRKMPWIAGPYLNISNSYSLLCLKEKFHCSGAFLSNELSRLQVKSIKIPEEFDLYYSVYHPILLMTSRQCLFHQVTGCTKESVDQSCLLSCEKTASMTNLKQVSLYIEKSKENYHNVFNGLNFLNTDILTDCSDRFTSFFIDMRRVITDTKREVSKEDLVHLFEEAVQEREESIKALQKVIHPITCIQYTKGI